MKKFSKKTNIILSVIICAFMVIGFVFSFVPMTFGSKTYVSLFSSLHVSTDLTGGMYGEYNIKTENPSEQDLIKSMSKIREVFEKDGYKNVNIYTVGNSKLRVEVGYPTGTNSYSSVYSSLTAVYSGKFLLSSSSATSGDGVVTVDGAECVDDIQVYSNNGTNYISIIFNDYGVEQYKALCKKTTTIYIHLGTYNQSIDASNVSDYTTFTLSDDDYNNLVALKKRVTFGCMSIELDSDTAVIDTMSTSLGLGSTIASSPEEAGFKSSAILTIVCAVCFIVVVLVLAAFALKFGMFACVICVSSLISALLTLVILYLIPSIEIGFTSIIAMLVSYVLTYAFVFNYASSVKAEYEVGKTFYASLESAKKKTFSTMIIGNIFWLIAAISFSAFSFGEVTSALNIFAIGAFLSILTNVLFVPLFVKMGVSSEKIGTKLFMLKKRHLGLISDDKPVIISAEEDK